MDNLNLPPGIGTGFPLEQDLSSSDLWLRWAPDQFCLVRVVSPQVYHYKGHWYAAARTFRLCTAPPGHPRPIGCCRFCPEGHRPGEKGKGAPAEWRFFLAVQTEDGQQRIWEFSKPVAEQVAALVSANGGRWAGLTLRLSRAGKLARGAVQVAVAPEPPDLGLLPVPMDAPGLLAQTWVRAALKDGKSATAEMDLTVQEILFSAPAASAPSPPIPSGSAASSGPSPSIAAAKNYLLTKSRKQPVYSGQGKG